MKRNKNEMKEEKRDALLKMNILILTLSFNIFVHCALLMQEECY